MKPLVHKVITITSVLDSEEAVEMMNDEDEQEEEVDEIVKLYHY